MWTFVVDLDKYAGNFERELTAFCTGHVGECEVGCECAKLFYSEFSLENSPFPGGYDWSGEEPDNTVPQLDWVPDEHGCHRPCSIKRSPAPNATKYNSVAIYFDQKPSDEQMAVIQARANRFFAERVHRSSEGATVEGFRLFEKQVKEIEHSVPFDGGIEEIHAGGQPGSIG